MVRKGDLEKRRDLGKIIKDAMKKKNLESKGLIYLSNRDPILDIGMNVVTNAELNRYVTMPNEGNILNHIRKLISILNVLELDLEDVICEIDRRSKSDTDSDNDSEF